MKRSTAQVIFIVCSTSAASHCFVEEDIGFKFDIRKCRRTFGQRAINEGQSIHDVSLVMGHSMMATTQKDYCDKDEHDAARDMQRYWNAKEASE